MRYVSRDSSGRFAPNAYEDYLEQAREALSARIQGDELLTIRRFAPAGPESFHDARFESFVLTKLAGENAASGRPGLEAELRLKGPYFDRRFALRYASVSSCEVHAPAADEDLLVHEIREEDGRLVHELQFDGNTRIEIACREMQFNEISTDLVSDGTA